MAGSDKAVSWWETDDQGDEQEAVASMGAASSAETGDMEVPWWETDGQGDEQEAVASTVAASSAEGSAAETGGLEGGVAAKRRRRRERTRLAVQSGQVQFEEFDQGQADKCLEGVKQWGASRVLSPSSLIMPWPCDWAALPADEAANICATFPCLSLSARAKQGTPGSFQLLIHSANPQSLQEVQHAFLEVDALTKRAGFEVDSTVLPPF